MKMGGNQCNSIVGLNHLDQLLRFMQKLLVVTPKALKTFSVFKEKIPAIEQESDQMQCLNTELPAANALRNAFVVEEPY